MSSPRDIEMINQNTDAEVAKLLALLGATGDAGGSASAGSIMAKINEILKNTDKATAIATEPQVTGTAAYWALHAWYKAREGVSLLQNTTYGLSALKNNRKICKASNTVLATIINAETVGLDGEFIDKQMQIVGFSGVVRVKYSIKGAPVIANPGGIYKSDIYAGDCSALRIVKLTTGTDASYITSYADISVKDGDILRFQFRSGNANKSVYCNLLTVCGTLSEAATGIIAL